MSPLSFDETFEQTFNSIKNQAARDFNRERIKVPLKKTETMSRRSNPIVDSRDREKREKERERERERKQIERDSAPWSIDSEFRDSIVRFSDD